MIQFSTKQKTAIQQGAIQRKCLKSRAKQAAKSSLDKDFPHTYIFSPPGLGKTFTVNQAIKEAGAQFHTVSGNVSMFAFGVKLATIYHYSPKDTPIIISVDDCDEILKNEANVNILKNVLAGDQIYSYEKSMASQLSNLSDMQRVAVEALGSPDSMGFRVPCQNMIFIFTSNKKLPTKDDLGDGMKRGDGMKQHLHAIRSRCQTIDFDLDWESQWGWIADCVLNDDGLPQLKEQMEKMILLDWMYNNWQNLTEADLRTVNKLAENMIDDPTGYRDTWEVFYLK